MSLNISKNAGWHKTAHLLKNLSSPLTPSPEDNAIMHDALVEAGLEKIKSPKILLLGMTPSIVQMPWPGETHLLAVDSSDDAIASLWEPNSRIRSEALKASWNALPFDAEQFDFIVGDCSLNALSNYDDWAKTLIELKRVIKPNGRLVLRFFMRPDESETPEGLVQLARERTFARAIDFRLRLAMSISDHMGHAYIPNTLEAFNRIVNDREQFSIETGWSREEVDRGDVGLSQDLHLTYPNLSQVKSEVSPFFLVGTPRYGSYVSAKLCPTISFQPIG